MDDLTKSLLREMIREELARHLPALLAATPQGAGQPGPEGPRGKRGPRGDPGPAADLTPLQGQLDAWLSGAEVRLHNLVNGVESHVGAHLAAAGILARGEG